MGFFSKILGKKTPPIDLSLVGTDMHSHLIPGIDDGARTMDETIAMLIKFEALGYKKVITTPHIMNEVYPNTPDTILSGLARVRSEIEKLGLGIQVEAAAEYYLDETLLSKIKDRSVLSFGDNYVLIEFSFHIPPVFEHELFFEMQMLNYKPVLAHFERYIYFHGDLDKAREYKEKGALIQLNLNSLSGHYGPDVKRQAERLIDAKLVDFVGTDCHRMDHLMLLEKNLSKPYFHKLMDLNLLNKDL
jgi:protein-tyrosine phosphatase